jgi:hypothetical protein
VEGKDSVVKLFAHRAVLHGKVWFNYNAPLDPAYKAGLAVAPPVNRTVDKPVDNPVYKKYKLPDVNVLYPIAQETGNK